MNENVCPTVNPPRFGDTETEMVDEPVTVNVVDPEMIPSVAEIVLVPASSADASPEDVIVAEVVFEDAQVTLLVRFCVLLSE